MRTHFFGLGQPNDLPSHVHLVPSEGELLAPAHSRIDADNEGWVLIGIVAEDDR